MNGSFKPCLIILLLISAAAFAQPKISFNTLEYNIGTVKQGEAAQLNIPFTNTGNKPLFIMSAKGSGPPAVSHSYEPVAPGGVGYIGFKAPTDFIADFRHNVYVTTNINSEVIVLTVRLKVVENDNPVRNVSGTVTDDKALPIPGAVIAVKELNNHATTDLEGKFSIYARASDTLTIDFIGYVTQIVSANDTLLKIRLQERDDIMDAGPPPFPAHRIKKMPDITTVTSADIINARKPKYDFRKNEKKGIFIIYVSAAELMPNPEDEKFQKQYNVRYSISGSLPQEYMLENNRLVFKHLIKAYGNVWKGGIRPDTVGLNR